MVSWVRDDIDMCPEDRWKDLACMSYSLHVIFLSYTAYGTSSL